MPEPSSSTPAPPTSAIPVPGSMPMPRLAHAPVPCPQTIPRTEPIVHPACCSPTRPWPIASPNILASRVPTPLTHINQRVTRALPNECKPYRRCFLAHSMKSMTYACQLSRHHVDAPDTVHPYSPACYEFVSNLLPGGGGWVCGRWGVVGAGLYGHIPPHTPRPLLVVIRFHLRFTGKIRELLVYNPPMFPISGLLPGVSLIGVTRTRR